jgi:hypothetical protein
MESRAEPAVDQSADKAAGQGPRPRLVWIAGALVAVLAAVYAGRYLMVQFAERQKEQSDPGDEFLIDSFEDGTFRQIQFGDYPQILVEDNEGKVNAYACSDGCPPLDQEPDLYENRRVRVYLRNQSTPGSDDPAETGIKVVVRVEILP